MTDRGRLIELISQADDRVLSVPYIGEDGAEALADYLLANGIGAKAEAVKEFWEKLKVEGKKKVDYYTPDGCDNYFRNGTLCGYVAMKEAGDSILKEMIGDAQ